MGLEDAVAEMTRRALAARDKGIAISARKAAPLFGISVARILQPWNVPGFKLKGTAWPFATWCEWLEIPEWQRRAEWDAMPVSERR